MSLKDFAVLQKIGEGSYSSVHKVRRLSDNQEYALKKVKLQGLSQKEKDNALNEIRILASIAHENMIAYKDAFFDESSHSLCIIMELASNGDLQKKIETTKKKNSFIQEEEIWTIALHLLRGLKALHSKKILHRDLKCANVFISKNDDFKLGDLNVSKVAKKGLVYTQTGTPYYASPEVWRDEPYDSSSDIWSFGCILYELAALNPPFRAKDMEQLYKKVQKGVFERIPKKYSQDLQKFISLCLQVSCQQRPSVTQLLQNDLLKKNTHFLPETQEDLQDKENAISAEDLLNTIRMPKNLRQLKEKLPQSRYNKEVQNKSYDITLIPQKNSLPRNSSHKMNRISSVSSHKKQKSINGMEINERVLPLLTKQSLEVQNSQQQLPQSILTKNKKYENLQSIVSDSRNYLDNNMPKGRLVQSSNGQISQQQSEYQNYNEDYSKKIKQVYTPTISIVSKKDLSSRSIQTRLQTINQVIPTNQISHPRLAEIQQKQSPYSQINNKNNNQYQDPTFSKPVWWG